MPVNLPLPQPEQLRSIAGVDIGFAEAGIRKAGRKDLLVLRLAAGTEVAGVFTLNRFCAAPVTVCRQHLGAAKAAANSVANATGVALGKSAGDGIRALIVNTGNANAGTGEPGLANARSTCTTLARELGST